MEETYYEKEARERSEWLASLKVGDKVAVSYRDWTFGEHYGIGTVIKTTPSHKLDVRFGAQAPQRYRANGYLEGSTTGNTIIPVTDKIKDTNRRFRAFRRISYLKDENWLKLPTEALEAVYDIVQKHLPQEEK